MDGDELDAYLSRELKRARRAALLDAAMAVCEPCGKLIPVFKRYGNHWWHDMTPGSKEYGCAATAIHNLIAAEPEEENEE